MNTHLDNLVETHSVDQTLIFTGGRAKAIVNGEEREVGAGDVVVVPAGCKVGPAIQIQPHQ